MRACVRACGFVCVCVLCRRMRPKRLEAKAWDDDTVDGKVCCAVDSVNNKKKNSKPSRKTFSLGPVRFPCSLFEKVTRSRRINTPFLAGVCCNRPSIVRATSVSTTRARAKVRKVEKQHRRAERSHGHCRAVAEHVTFYACTLAHDVKRNPRTIRRAHVHVTLPSYGHAVA
jgi:hypothetical protein